MRVKTRKGIFETNSSSTHALTFLVPNDENVERIKEQYATQEVEKGFYYQLIPIPGVIVTLDPVIARVLSIAFSKGIVAHETLVFSEYIDGIKEALRLMLKPECSGSSTTPEEGFYNYHVVGISGCAVPRSDNYGILQFSRAPLEFDSDMNVKAKTVKIKDQKGKLNVTPVYIFAANNAPSLEEILRELGIEDYIRV